MRQALIGVVLAFFAAVAGAQGVPAIVPLTAHVVDQTATLSAAQRARLETKLTDFERRKGAQITVLVVASVAPQGVAEYALRVVEAARIGRQGIDDGALLLVAKDDRKLRIEVGYGLEGVLSDALAKRIISETIAPRFKAGDFYGGIDAGVDAMIKVVDGEPLPAPKPASAASAAAAVTSDSETLIFVAFILVFVVGGVLRALLGRFLAAGVIGAVAGFAATMLVSSLLLGVLAGIVAFIVSLFAGVGGLGGIAGGRGSWSSGRSSWGGGSRGGGFSGGGGGFGGGGASGGW